MAEYVPWIVYQNILVYLDKIGAKPTEKLSREIVTKKVQMEKFLAIHAMRNDKKIAIVIVEPDSEYEKKSQFFGKMIDRVVGDDKELSLIKVVSDKKPSSNIIKKTVKELNEKSKKGINLSIEHILYDVFKFDVTKHILADEHRVLPKEEEKSILESLKKEKYNLPRIKTRTDPMAIWATASTEDVIKISGASDISIETVEYRICV